MKLNSIEMLLEDQLKDLFSAENQLVKALPKMQKHATTPALSKAIQKHLVETERHVERLQRAGETLGIKLGGKKCKAMEGLIEEGEEALKAEGDPKVLDAAIIAAAQRVEHYEISGYGTARTLAEALGHDQVAKLLQQTLDEESAADETLTEISVGEILPLAAGRA